MPPILPSKVNKFEGVGHNLSYSLLMDILALKQSMTNAMEFADDFLRRLKIAMETAQSNGNLLAAKIREIEEAGGEVSEDLHQRMRDQITIREYQLKYLDSAATFKTRVAQVLSVAMDPPKDNFLNRGKLSDLQKGAELVERMMNVIRTEFYETLGEDLLTITQQGMHQEAVKLMAERLGKQNTKPIPKEWLN